MKIKQNRKLTCLWITGMFFLSVHLPMLAQSGWTQKKGNYFAKLYGTYGKSDQYYTLHGAKSTTAEFIQFASGLYFEYGLTDRLTLISNGPVVKRQYFETTTKITAVGDLPLGIKYGLLQGNFPLAASLMIDIPLAKKDNYAQNKEIAFDQINLPAGDGEWNYRLGIAASHSFYPIPLFASLNANYNLRTKYNDTKFSDQFTAGLEAGSVLNRFILISAISFQKSLGESEVVDFVRGEGTEFTLLKASAGLYLTKRFLIDLTYFTYIDLLTDRRNIYSSNIFSLGFVYELKD